MLRFSQYLESLYFCFMDKTGNTEVNSTNDGNSIPNSSYDEVYLKKLREKAKRWLESINPDEWLKEVRGTVPTPKSTSPK